MIIRRFKKNDAKTLEKLSKYAAKEIGCSIDKSKDFIKIFNKSKNLIWIAEERFNVIGFLYGDMISRKGIVNSDKSLELAMIYIIKKYRNKGIATKLVKKFLDVWKRSKYKGVFSIATSAKSKLLLERLGFKQKVYFISKRF